MLVRGQTEQILSSLIVDLFQSDVSFVSQKSLSLLLEFHHRVSKNKQKTKKKKENTPSGPCIVRVAAHCPF